MAGGVGAEEGGGRREDGGGGDDAVGGGGGGGGRGWRVGAGTDEIRASLHTTINPDSGNIQHLHMTGFIFILY